MLTENDEAPVPTRKIWIVLGLVIIGIIIAIPWLYTFTSGLRNYSHTGEIGDTVGGLTAPFINGLSAILIYLAFKEQVRANNLLVKENRSIRLQETIKTINDQLNKVRSEHETFTNDLLTLANRLQRINVSFEQSEDSQILLKCYNNIWFILIEFESTIEMIESFRELSPTQANAMMDKLEGMWHVLFKESLRSFFIHFEKMFSQQGGHRDHREKKIALQFYFDLFESKFIHP